jgi:hypothetical protein
MVPPDRPRLNSRAISSRITAPIRAVSREPTMPWMEADRAGGADHQPENDAVRYRFHDVL